jgi:hypothetical protein
MHKLIIACMLLVPVTCAAQSAKVMALDTTDAAEAQKLHRQQEELDARREAFETHIREKYLSRIITVPVCASISIGNTTPSDPPKYCGMSKEEYERRSKQFSPLSGWEYGFIFDDSYRYVVPKTYTPQPCNSNGISLTGCAVYTPFVTATSETTN